MEAEIREKDMIRGRNPKRKPARAARRQLSNMPTVHPMRIVSGWNLKRLSAPNGKQSRSPGAMKSANENKKIAMFIVV